MTIAPRNIMVTTSRMPFALDEIRKLGRRGHHVVAVDTFDEAPGSHSRHAGLALCVPSPRFDTAGFIDDIERLVVLHEIDLLVPTFEEAVYLMAHEDRLRPHADIFAPKRDTLVQLHDKDAFRSLALELGLDVPFTLTAKSHDELHTALRVFPQYFARHAFSRGGVQLLTNTGPLAGAVEPEELNPTPGNPVLVQPFTEGEDECSLSVCHHGRVVAHASYVHPKEIEHAGGIVFRSTDPAPTLAIAQKIAEATDYHGQLSLDYMRTPDGRHTLIECNPRATAGVIMMPDEMFERALFAPADEPELAPEGVEHKFTSALLRDIVTHPEAIGEDLQYILGPAREVYFDLDDPAPGWWQLLSYVKVLEYRRHLGRTETDRTDLMAAYFYDVQYDGPNASERSLS